MLEAVLKTIGHGPSIPKGHAFQIAVYTLAVLRNNVLCMRVKSLARPGLLSIESALFSLKVRLCFAKRSNFVSMT